MSEVKAPLSLKFRVALASTIRFLRNPKYALFTLLWTVFGFALINALFDIELLLTLATLDVALSFRLEAIRDVLFSVSGLPLPNAVATVVMAILFGYVISASILVARRLNSKKASKAGASGILFGIISGGCAACGTSLLAPVLTVIGVTGTSAALEFALIMNVIGIALLLYSSYKVSLVLANTAS